MLTCSLVSTQNWLYSVGADEHLAAVDFAKEEMEYTVPESAKAEDGERFFAFV